MSEKRVVAFVPARMGASRFPGKPLCNILGLPMVEHVRRRVSLCSTVDEVYVATCDAEIMEVVTRAGGKAIMTGSHHERCTDRIEEAARTVDHDITVIVQGDEPLVDPDLIDRLVGRMLSDDAIGCANLLSVIHDEKDLDDIDVVKAVLDSGGFLLYYSRAPIPFRRTPGAVPMYRQTGLSVFRREFLEIYSKLRPTPLEIAESVDFLRILEHGHRILGVVDQRETAGVDRPDDVGRVEKVLREDPSQRKTYEKLFSSS